MVAIESEDANLPWVEKYRPTSLDELISHTDIIATLSKLVQEDRLPHLLFYGPPGTGKTSTIIAAARTMYGMRDYRSMVLELNASDERGIGVVRDQIISFAQTRTLTFNRAAPSRAKLIILDEADAMTRDAQNALRRIVEKFTDNVRFCLICNYLSRVIPAIQSRCTRFRFAPLTQDQMRPRVQAIAQAENVKLTEDGERALLALAQGDMRRVINILQSTSMAFAEVNERNVHLCVGQATPGEINRCLTTLLNDSFGQAFEKLDRLRVVHGYALADLVGPLCELVLRLDAPSEVLSRLVVAIAEVEARLAVGCSDRMQLAAIVAAFLQTRAQIARIATES